MKQWVVYIVQCSDGSLYTGITNDLPARIYAHNMGHGAKYTMPRRPVELIWKCTVATKSDALRLEAKIKKLKRCQKELIVSRAMTPAGIRCRFPGGT